MRNRRKNWLLRRLVLGLAVAAIVAPAAQARVDEGGTAQSDGGNGVFIQGDDRMLAHESLGVPVRADDKVLAPDNGGVAVRGDDKVMLPYSDGIPVRADDKVLAPDNTGGHPAGRQVPIAATGTGGDFNWGDGLIGAAAALGLALLAFGAARATRHVNRPATT